MAKPRTDKDKLLDIFHITGVRVSSVADDCFFASGRFFTFNQAGEIVDIQERKPASRD